MVADATMGPLPLVPFIGTAPDGEPYLAGSRCDACGALFVGLRSTCARCSVRGRLQPFRIANGGRVHSFTIVERSFPGVATPFVDVVVDMDDGTHLKGTLDDVEPSVTAVRFDMPVRIVFREVRPAGSDGRTYLSYVFVPDHTDETGTT